MPYFDPFYGVLSIPLFFFFFFVVLRKLPLVLLHCLCTSSSRRYVREDTVRNTYRHQQQEKSVFNKKKTHTHSKLSFFFSVLLTLREVGH